MKDEVNGPLNGDLPVESPNDGSRHEEDDWDRMVAAFRTSAPRGAAGPWLEQKVMAEVEALPEPGGAGRFIGWLLRPAAVQVSPLAAGLVVAAFALALLIPTAATDRIVGEAPERGSGPEPVIYVQFTLEAPAASTVAVAGDFSEWQPSFTLSDPDGDGVWSGRVPVRPGVHGYMFLIDGTEWQTDPRAERYQDDGFGNRNAIVAVAAGV
jgi:AMP-activated protein kinase-like protein